MGVLDFIQTAVSSANAQRAAMTPAQLSDFVVSAAKGDGKWVLMSNGGYLDPRDPHVARAADGSWYAKSSGQNFGFATSETDPIKHGLASVAGAVTSGIASVADKVASTVKRASTDVTHPGELVHDLAAAVKAAPGLALTGVTGVAQLAVIGAAATAEGVGKVTGAQGLVDAGKSVIKTTLAVDKSAVDDPISSAEVLAGGALVVTGIGTAAGVGLLGKGAVGLAGDTIMRGQAEATSKLPATPVDGSGLSSRSLAADVQGVSLFDRFRLWLRGLLHA